VRTVWATISAIASVPHETRRVFVTEGRESSAALVVAAVSYFAARRAASATDFVLRPAEGRGRASRKRRQPRPAHGTLESRYVDFELVGDLTDIETIAAGRGIRDLPRLRRLYGKG
jgi:hypothetical protein